MSNIFCISDTHFGQEEIIQYNDRPFKNAKDMFEKIKSNWNSVVGSGDTVYHVGDFSAGKVNVVHPSELLPQLNGKVHLIKGNKETEQNFNLDGFVSISYPYKLIEHKNIKVLFCHYPPTHDTFKSLIPKNLKYDFVAYGHWHHEHEFKPNSYCVGVDLNSYTPISLDKILKENYRQNVSLYDRIRNKL